MRLIYKRACLPGGHWRFLLEDMEAVRLRLGRDGEGDAALHELEGRIRGQVHAGVGTQHHRALVAGGATE